MSRLPLTADRVRRAKHAYTTRHVRPEAMSALLTGAERPAAGDLVLATVTALGQHRRLELATGRKSQLFPGDEVVVAYGHRYAPDQFEAEVPADLGPCELVAGGGLAARSLSHHAVMRGATALEPVGLLADGQGARLNLGDWSRPSLTPCVRRPPTVAVVGTSMNAGKTTAAASLVHGLVVAGRRVGTAKVTGTGSGGDTWAMLDAGAAVAFDVTDAGHATSAHLPASEVERILATLTAHLAVEGVDAIVLEVADGLLQDETASLVASRAFAHTIDGLLFAAGDAMGAIGGVRHLQGLGLPVVGATGVVTASPLAARETAARVDVPVLGLAELCDPTIAVALAAGPARSLAQSA